MNDSPFPYTGGGTALRHLPPVEITPSLPRQVQLLEAEKELLGLIPRSVRDAVRKLAIKMAIRPHAAAFLLLHRLRQDMKDEVAGKKISHPLPIALALPPDLSPWLMPTDREQQIFNRAFTPEALECYRSL